jgi:hypothetical protein
MDEPRYVDPDDPWEDDQIKKDKTNLSGIENIHLLGMLRNATGRKMGSDFQSPKEKRRFMLIHDQYKKGLTPFGWIESCVEWAKSKNKQRTIIMFPALVSAILNKARMQDWISKQPKNVVATEKYADPDAFD